MGQEEEEEEVVEPIEESIDHDLYCLEVLSEDQGFAERNLIPEFIMEMDR